MREWRLLFALLDESEEPSCLGFLTCAGLSVLLPLEEALNHLILASELGFECGELGIDASLGCSSGRLVRIRDGVSKVFPELHRIGLQFLEQIDQARGIRVLGGIQVALGARFELLIGALLLLEGM